MTTDIDSSSDVTPRWLDEEQQRTWRAFLLATTLLQGRLDDDLREKMNMSMVEYEVMVRLTESGGSMRMANLADSLAHSRSRVTHTIARMEKAGLVQRHESPEDRRGVIAEITEAGWALLRRAAPVHVNGVRDYLVDVASPEDFAAVRRVMDAVADRLVGDHPACDNR